MSIEAGDGTRVASASCRLAGTYIEQPTARTRRVYRPRWAIKIGADFRGVSGANGIVDLRNGLCFRRGRVRGSRRRRPPNPQRQRRRPTFPASRDASLPGVLAAARRHVGRFTFQVKAADPDTVPSVAVTFTV